MHTQKKKVKLQNINDKEKTLKLPKGNKSDIQRNEIRLIAEYSENNSKISNPRCKKTMKSSKCLRKLCHCEFYIQPTLLIKA